MPMTQIRYSDDGISTGFYGDVGLGGGIGGWPRVGAVPTLGFSVQHEKCAVVSMSMTQIGYVYDSTSYYRARYYDPTIGRFISEDPAGFAGSGTNSYAYVRNSPINLIDPLGLCPKDKTPCASMGNALTPSQYAALGSAFGQAYLSGLSDDEGTNLAQALAWLYSNFHKGGALDAQPSATGDSLQRATYGNYVYGVFFAAAGISLDGTLTAASTYGYKQRIFSFGKAYRGRKVYSQYQGIPAANVDDIYQGYADFMSGQLCDQTQ